MIKSEWFWRRRIANLFFANIVPNLVVYKWNVMVTVVVAVIAYAVYVELCCFGTKFSSAIKYLKIKLCTTNGNASNSLATTKVASCACKIFYNIFYARGPPPHTPTPPTLSPFKIDMNNRCSMHIRWWISFIKNRLFNYVTQIKMVWLICVNVPVTQSAFIDAYCTSLYATACKMREGEIEREQQPDSDM